MSRRFGAEIGSGYLDDEELVSAAQCGDQTAFGLLVERYRAYVYTIAYKIVLHEDDALDITQEVFMRMAHGIRSFSGRGSFKSWLGACTSKAAISERRKSARRNMIAPLADTEAEAQDGATDAEQLRSVAINARDFVEKSWQRTLLDQAMKSLSPQQRAIFGLHLREDLSPSEIAGALDIPVSQVRSQLSRAVQRLRIMMSEQEKDSAKGGTRHER
jgi:RNA polymerase sigma-70 factor, ECF subfamily